MKNNKNRSKLILSNIQKEILVGTLLGNAFIQKGKFKSRVFWDVQTDKDEDKNEGLIQYMENISMHFNEWVRSSPVIDIFFTRSIELSTYMHSAFNEYYKLFYKDEFNKCVPSNIVELLTPRSLAYWFMSIGLIDFKQKIYIMPLTRSCKNLNECYLLRDVLFFKFNIKSNIYVHALDLYSLYILPESVKDFTELIEPYILDCMKHNLIRK